MVFEIERGVMPRGWPCVGSRGCCPAEGVVWAVTVSMRRGKSVTSRRSYCRACFLKWVATRVVSQAEELPAFVDRMFAAAFHEEAEHNAAIVAADRSSHHHAADT